MARQAIVKSVEQTTDEIIVRVEFNIDGEISERAYPFPSGGEAGIRIVSETIKAELSRKCALKDVYEFAASKVGRVVAEIP